MAIRLRQVALVAGDLPVAEAAIENELGLSRCWRDPGVAEFGLHNALYPVGDSLLEVVSPLPDRPDTTAGRFLDRRGDGGYMAIFETDEPLEDVRARLDRLGVRVVFEARAAGVTGLHLHPRDVGGAIVSIDRTEVWGEWPWAGPGWRDHRTNETTALDGIRLGVDDPAAAAQRWADVLGHPLAHGSTIVDLDDATFVEFALTGPRGQGIDVLTLTTSGPSGRASLAGCDVDLVTPLDPDDVFSAIERGDLDAVDSMWADDIGVWHNTDGVTQNKAANLATLRWLIERTTTRRYTDVRRRPTSDGFVQQHVLQLGFADGRTAALPAALVVAVRAGRVRRIDEYIDSAGVAAAFDRRPR